MNTKSSPKLKLLYLMEILEKNTDENNVLNANDICIQLKKLGIECERKSVYSDIKLLKENGFDIINTRYPKNGYFLASRDFEFAEVRLLLDAVLAADFITPKKTEQLIDKMSCLVSGNDFEKLKNQVNITNRVKCDNEEIYYNIDVLHRAIESGKQVSFEYIRHRINKKVISSEEKEFTVNPYALIWSNDHYYLVCNNPKYTNLMHVRLDRMKKARMLQTPSDSFEKVSEYKEKFDAADYANKTFNMFSGEVSEIRLLCDNSLLEDIYDRFGDDAKIRNEDSNRFSLAAKAAVSEGLVSWIMQYGSKIYVKSPDELRNMIIIKTRGIMELYSE